MLVLEDFAKAVAAAVKLPHGLLYQTKRPPETFSEFQRVRDSEVQGTEYPRLRRSGFGGAGKESARTNEVAVRPLERALNRVGVQEPHEVGSEPVRAHCPKRTFSVADVADIRPAVREEHSLLTIRLKGEEVEEVGEFCFLALFGEFGADAEVAG